MKKLFPRILILPISLFFISQLQAQNTSFGIKGGVNVATLAVEDGEEYDSKTGFHGGLLAHIHISRHFAVQPELVYSCQGGEIPAYKLKLGYLNLPVLAQYMINDGFRLQTGPQIGFLMSAEQKMGDVEVDVASAYDNIDFAWVVGAGYLFKNGVGVDLRYNIGLTDVADATNTDLQNRVLQLGLFYQFKRKK